MTVSMSESPANPPGPFPPRYRTEAEGQFLERKSCFNRRGRTLKPLAWRSVAEAIAETVVAFANADGGELVVGLDDDGAISGIPYPPGFLAKFADVPESRILPPLRTRSTVYEVDGKTVLHFEVDSSRRVHRTTSGKHLYRDKDTNLPVDAEFISHLKALKRETLTEHAIIPDAALADLREDLIRGVIAKMDPSLGIRDALLQLGLAEPSNGQLRITFAALLLFGRDAQRWHPKAHVEYLRFRGNRREHGRRLNMIARKSVIAPLVELPTRLVEVVLPEIGQRQILHDLFFTERAEYPPFVWQEALVNAVAHRNYGLRGTPIELHHYDDRLEVVSPGIPVPPITLQALRGGGGGHASRNPLIVRVLTLLGLMREIGEGVPRMFAEMAENGLHPPEFDEGPAGCLTVTLRNAPVWDEGIRAWLAGFKDRGLTPNQMRLFVMARQQGGRFTSAQYQTLVGADIYTASREIKELIRKELVSLEKKGGRVYRLTRSDRPLPPDDYRRIASELRVRERLTNRDLRGIWGTDRQSALRRARQLVDSGWLRAEGERRGRRYLAGPKA